MCPSFTEMAGEFERHPFLLPVQDVAKSLETDVERGLTSAQVAQLQQKYPPNELDVGGTIPWYKIMLKQLFNAMILVSIACPLSILTTLSSSLTDSCQLGLVLCHDSEFCCQ